jgi:extracellular factor (EF) 3-hydroxypalmitic acid methyl ester biosynthesis protein
VTERLAGTESLVTFVNAGGFQGRGTLLHLTRQAAVFEVYNPHSIVQLSEVLNGFTMSRGERLIYRGRAVVTTLVPAGSLLIVSATLVDAWSDMAGLESVDALRTETRRFISDWAVGHQLQPDFQLAVTSMASFLQEFSRWVNEAEVALGELGDSGQRRLDLYESVKQPLLERLGQFVACFEACAGRVSEEESWVHRAFTQRQLHPLMLTAPFVHRSFVKPLGYAGDYEMVNMMLEEPDRGPNTYARIINTAHVGVGPAAAHRNRIEMLVAHLIEEASRAKREGRSLRVLNIGCGPAAEVERFLRRSALADICHFELMDFNEPTLQYARDRLEETCRELGRKAQFTWHKRSIHELLREARKPTPGDVPRYDFVYCAGLYDYLTDRVCTLLTRLFYSFVAPGGLVIATNVHPDNPVRFYMDFLVEWHLEYRNERQMLELARDLRVARAHTDSTGVNVFVEIRKPMDDDRAQA